MESKFHSLCDIPTGGGACSMSPDQSNDNNQRRASKIESDAIARNVTESINQDLKGLNEATTTTNNQANMMINKRSKKQSNKLIEDEKPHFRIDWRQLSYYHTENSWKFRLPSLTGAAACKNDDKFSCDYESEQKQEQREHSKPGKSGRFILNSLDGHFKSGELSAILGPSGAGKSTFLSTLFGARQEQATGRTRLTWLRQKGAASNDFCSGPNVDVTPKYERRPLRVAFLPQQDHLLHHLTVYETLLFASRLKNQTLNTNLDETQTQGEQINKQREKINARQRDSDSELAYHVANVKRVARMLKLTDCLNTRCGKLSGGQYKRVSIGQELLSQPDVIILDEPTSGLDASTCLSTVRTLKTIVNGKLPISIILTIHQPDSDVFRLFDRVYVIAQGGMAIYEGPPSGIMATMAQVGLEPPRESYNAARFIVENAFLSEPADDEAFHVHQLEPSKGSRKATPTSKRRWSGSANDLYHSSSAINDEDDSCSLMSSSSDDSCDLDWQEEQPDPNNNNNNNNPLGKLSSALTKSLVSLKDTLSGREIKFPEPNNNEGSGIKRGNKKREISCSRPLLAQIGGFKTLGGRIIKAEKLALKRDYDQNNDGPSRKDAKGREKGEFYLNGGCGVSGPDDCATTDLNRVSILRQLNQIQRCAYLSEPGWLPKSPNDSKSVDYSSAASTSSAENGGGARGDAGAAGAAAEVVLELGLQVNHSINTTNSNKLDSNQEDNRTSSPTSAFLQRSRDFDKRLSAKHNSQHHKSAGVFYQARLLAHRTWLSIVRDPIFFGIQAFMHTTIPILLALIFGNHQDEACPRLGSFDLVQFAYSGHESASSPITTNGASKSMISDTVSSIRLTIGNVGIIFFEMFVLMFAINCITALVFPADMFVLLKEYRNGWYSMSSYFMGRSLADLPIPVFLHSLAIIILCMLTKQPLEFWRLSLIILLVIMASLIAQSVGLTVGAILMRSSQSAVLAAAGIVAPFFALSGFIVRIHTLPWAAQLFAKVSYLHQLLNGFIILRYGFNRCPCKEEDFDEELGHQVPQQLHTMASIWVGTFSDEFNTNNNNNNNTTNNKQLADPNIDVVQKIMNSFKIANTFGHQMSSCKDVRPYAMLDFNLHDSDLTSAFLLILCMIILSRVITFAAIYYKVRSAT